MDNCPKPKDLSKTVAAESGPSNLDPRQRPEVEAKDSIAARKVQKADREKLRRDRLNEHFLELGNTLDPDRPKNDKATILTDTIQMLKDITAEVGRLKAECAALSGESRELMQEKNELREEKASLKADVDNLNVQYQQRVRVMFPWGGMDTSVVMAPPFSYAVPLPVPASPISMHPSLQQYSFFGNHNSGPIAGPCSTFIPYSTSVNPQAGQPSQHASSSHVSGRREVKSKSVEGQKDSNGDTCDDSSNVATELELKMPGSSAQKDSSSAGKKRKQTHKKERRGGKWSSSNLNSSSQGQGLQDSSSDSVDDVWKSNK